MSTDDAGGSELQQAVAGIGDSPASYWLAEIASAKRWYAEWQTRGNRVIRRYKDENNDREMIQNTRGRKMAMLWSNVETVKPALYSQTPVPNISRRNKDQDPVGRWAAIVLERCVVNSLGSQDFDKTMRDVVQDLLLPGRGVAIEEYEAEIGTQPGAEGQPPVEAVTSQKSSTRYLHWKDFLTNQARIWDEVWWGAYVVYLTKEEVADKFGKDIAAVIQLDHKQRDDRGRFSGADAKASVWTIWNKRKKEVIQVSPGYTEGFLRAPFQPPVKFDGFFPFPRPVQATTASDTIIPTPDFALYQDQADEIDLLTNKIYKLSESLRLRGLYPGDMDSVKRLLSDAGDTELIPVEQWAMLSERGGAAGLVCWFPLKDVAQTLIWCTEAREKAKGALYEVTGMGDIIRGASDASETATAQQLKSQWGSLRIRDRQRDIQRFARDLVRLKAEVVAEHFSKETLEQMSGVRLLTEQQKQTVQSFLQVKQQFDQAAAQYPQMAAQAAQQGMQPPPPPQPPAVLTRQPPTDEMIKALKEPSWEQVIQLLRNDKLRSFQIDVETDSTVEPDQKAEQEKAVEFVTMATQFLTAGAQIMALPGGGKAAPLLGELLVFAARRFKVGETFETKVEEFADAMTQQAAQPPQAQQPSPAEQLKAQTEQIKGQSAVAVATTKGQAEQFKAQAGGQTAQIKAQAEGAKAQAELIGTIVDHHHTMEQKAAEQAIALAQPQPVAPNGAVP